MATATRLEQMNATEAKNCFGDLLEKASNNVAVSLMKHGKPAAYVISPALYELVRHRFKAGQGPLDRLEREFNELIARMQTPESVDTAKSLMTVDTADLRQRVRQRRRGRHA